MTIFDDLKENLITGLKDKLPFIKGEIFEQTVNDLFGTNGATASRNRSSRGATARRRNTHLSAAESAARQTEILRLTKTPKTVLEVAEALKARPAAIGSAMSHMYRAKKLRKQGKDKYVAKAA